ncbi:MAG: hypothetical protein LBG60_06410, partial [Bifidobacteriaceae bacterium]|nr:hypothetical protein [Bifidobacteriaceae bacterium]
MRFLGGGCRNGVRVLVAGLAAPLAVSSAALVGVAAASAAGDAAGGLVTFTVDSLALNDPAADCGDRSKRCTLRNALAAAEVIGADRDVRIEVASQLWDGANLVSEGNIPFPTDAGEIEEAGVSLTPWDKGAVFRVTRPLELDLGRRVHLIPPDGEDTSLVGVKEAAGLVVEAEDVRLRNFSDWYSYQSAIVFSAAADRSSLAGGQSIQSENNHTNRQIVVMAGADGVSISDYRLGRESSAADGAAIALTRLTSSTGAVDTVSNLTVDDVVFDNTPSAPANSTCNSTDGTGCSADGLYLHGSVKVDGLTVQNSVFQGFRQSGRQPIDAAAAGEMTNWEIRRNRFTDIQIKANDSNSATVLLKAPSGSRPGPVRVHDNDFDNSATPAVQGPAIYFEGAEAAESTRPSGVFIEDNRFDGYNPTVKLLNGGAVTVRRNTFGAGTTSAAGTGTAEETGTSGVMVTNSGQPTNRGIWTWYPTAASLTPCGFEVAVTPNSGAAKKGMAPNMPADLDFYWTASKTAEVY